MTQWYGHCQERQFLEQCSPVSCTIHGPYRPLELGLKTVGTHFASLSDVRSRDAVVRVLQDQARRFDGVVVEATSNWSAGLPALRRRASFFLVGHSLPVVPVLEAWENGQT